MFSGGATRRKEPGSANKRIRLRLRANYPYSLDGGECGQAPCEVFVSPGGTKLSVIAEGWSGEPTQL